MTDETERDPTAEWLAQFAPRAADAVEVQVVVTERAGTVEHFADEHGVFTAPAPKAEDAEAPAEDEAKADAKA